jgi:hypothetical protein
VLRPRRGQRNLRWWIVALAARKRHVTFNPGVSRDHLIAFEPARRSAVAAGRRRGDRDGRGPDSWSTRPAGPTTNLTEPSSAHEIGVVDYSSEYGHTVTA